jgi:hypothetical protein
MVLGVVIVAVKFREPTKPVSLTVPLAKVARPEALVVAVRVPAIVASLEDNVTVVPEPV